MLYIGCDKLLRVSGLFCFNKGLSKLFGWDPITIKTFNSLILLRIKLKVLQRLIQISLLNVILCDCLVKIIWSLQVELGSFDVLFYFALCLNAGFVVTTQEDWSCIFQIVLTAVEIWTVIVSYLRFNWIKKWFLECSFFE